MSDQADGQQKSDNTEKQGAAASDQVQRQRDASLTPSGDAKQASPGTKTEDGKPESKSTTDEVKKFAGVADKLAGLASTAITDKLKAGAEFTPIGQVIGAAKSAYHVATAENKSEAIKEEVNTRIQAAGDILGKNPLTATGGVVSTAKSAYHVATAENKTEAVKDEVKVRVQAVNEALPGTAARTAAYEGITDHAKGASPDKAALTAADAASQHLPFSSTAAEADKTVKAAERGDAVQAVSHGVQAAANFAVEAAGYVAALAGAAEGGPPGAGTAAAAGEGGAAEAGAAGGLSGVSGEGPSAKAHPGGVPEPAPHPADAPGVARPAETTPAQSGTGTPPPYEELGPEVMPKSTGPELPPYQSGKTPMKEGDMDYYKSFNTKSRGGDGLEGHEIIQASYLQAIGEIEIRGKGPVARDNPSLAVSEAMHDKIDAAQRSLGLYDTDKLAAMSPREIIDANTKALEMAGVERSQIETIKREAERFAEERLERKP